MTLWGGRFEERLDPGAWKLNASIHFDKRLAAQDIRGSLAWAEALKNAAVLTEDEGALINQGLEAILDEWSQGAFEIQEQDEDIHSAVERRLGEIIGPLAGKLHTGRSRNDQVATDFRLWLLDHIPTLDAALVGLQSALLERAERDLEVIMPGYTHLQRAQPILLSHWWLSHFWPLKRDRERLAELQTRTASLPLGSAALAGTSFPVDRTLLAQALGFAGPSQNSIDAVSDRDFAAEYLFCSALVGVHLSRLAEAIILFSSAEFGFFELADAFSTGSSLMPQKKNPDVFELARGKSGALIGSLAGLLTTLKGLPSTYDKDLQEDKAPVFAAFDTLLALLPVLAGGVSSLSVHKERMRAAIDPASMATDLTDELVCQGVPFREAHDLVGKAVQLSGRSGVPLDKLSSDELLSISPHFDMDRDRVFDAWQSVLRHEAIGGSAPSAVKLQIVEARNALPKNALQVFV